MNLVLDDAEEVYMKKKLPKKSIGRILLKGENITLMQVRPEPHPENTYTPGCMRGAFFLQWKTTLFFSFFVTLSFVRSSKNSPQTPLRKRTSIVFQDYVYRVPACGLRGGTVRRPPAVVWFHNKKGTES
jgi:hypothetical protein